MKWPVKKLGKFIDIVMGQAPNSEHCNKDGDGMIFVKAGEFGIESPVIREWTTDPLKIARDGDTLICVVGATAGKVNRSRFECAIGRSVASVRSTSIELNQDYLHSFLKTKILELRNRSQGAAQSVITREMLQDIDIPLPPLAEQKRIAELLDTADKIMRLREQAIVKLDELAKSLFNNLIATEESKEVNLSDYCEVVSGFAFKSENYCEDGDAYIIRISDIQNGLVRLDDAARIMQSDVGKGKEYRLTSDDILIAMSGATTGKFGILEKLNGASVYLNQRVGRFKITKDECLTKQFLISLLNSAQYQQHVQTVAAGAAQPNISAKQLVDLRIKLPTPQAQLNFCKKLNAIGKLKEESILSKNILHPMISSLQHQCFAVN